MGGQCSSSATFTNLSRKIVAEAFNENKAAWRIGAPLATTTISDFRSTAGYREIYEYQAEQHDLSADNTYVTPIKITVDDYQQQTKRDKSITAVYVQILNEPVMGCIFHINRQLLM